MVKENVEPFPGVLSILSYMYHCHILEHEDHDMMRPFVVMPTAALAAMDMIVQGFFRRVVTTGPIHLR
jgi:hypothetical protein